MNIPSKNMNFLQTESFADLFNYTYIELEGSVGWQSEAMYLDQKPHGKTGMFE